MASFSRKCLLLYLALTTVVTPILPSLAYAATAASTVAKQLPELGSAAAAQPTTIDSPFGPPDLGWQKQPGTDPLLAPAVVRERSQGIEQAVAQGAGMLSSAASEATEAWFARQHITAELALKLDHKGMRGGSLDVLVPFYNVGKNLLFTQLGARRANTYTEDYRNTVNLGLGYRRDVGSWLLGVNSFYDRDLTGKHDRMGVGLEAWTDFLKLSANSYQPLSDWKASPDRVDYQERPARGWDVRAEGYLPAYPQLGGKLMYEQYYGDEVSLFSANSRQQDPHAVTVGVLYNPVPMLGVAVNHRMGQDGMSDTSANLTLTYRFGESLAKQFSAQDLRASRLLEHMRYDLVARNNELVLDNRKQSEPLRLPAQISGAESHTLTFALSGAQALQGVTWLGSAAAFAQPYAGSGSGSLVLPAYIDGASNSYELQASAIDKNGRAVMSNPMTVVVQSVAFTVAANPAAIVANGASVTTLSATVKTVQGRAVGAGMPVTWTTSAGTLSSTSSVTNAAGVASTTLTSSNQVGTASVEASAGSAKSSTTVSFTADAPASGSSGMTLQATPASITADGSSQSIITATLRDARGNSVGSGVTVTWSTNAGGLASAQSSTDNQGVASMQLTSPILAGTATVLAIAGAAKNSIDLTFIAGSAAAGSSGLHLLPSPASITADGSSTSTLTATLLDTHGNPVVAGTAVTWTTSAGSLASPTSTTNNSGVATTTLTSSKVAGVALVNASSGSASNAASVTFAPGLPAAGALGLSLAVTSAPGSDNATLYATVKDANGNPLGAGATVTWATSAGTLAAPSSTTNSRGVASVVLTSTAVGQLATVQAASGAARNSASIAFHAGVPAVGSNGISIAVNAADGSTTAQLTATVRDAYGDAVGAGVTVSWTTNTGALTGTTSTTDASGVASMQLTSTLGSTASVQAATGAARNSVNVVFAAGTPAAGNHGISLAASPPSLAANGSDTATVSATVRDNQGQSVGAGVVVSWTSSLGSLASTTSTTDSAGVATVVLTSATVAGTATVQATSGAARNELNIIFTPGVPATGQAGLSLAATPAAINADGVSTSTLQATVKDSMGNPVDAGVVVTWTTSAGSLASTTSSTDARGVASMVLTSSTLVGAAVVEASAGAASNSANVAFIASAPASVSVTPSVATLTADGSSTSTLTATVLDAQGKPMPAGTAVSWTTSSGSLASASSTTNASGIATVVLTSSTVAGVATVQAVAGAAKGSSSVRYVAGALAKVVVTASPAALPADGTSKTTLIALATDANGNPTAAGSTVNWALAADKGWVSPGSLASSSSVVDGNGVASVEMTGRTWTGRTTATASIGSLRGTATVDFVLTMVMSATTDNIPKNGQSTVTAVVSGPNGQPAAGVTVFWEVLNAMTGSTQLSATSSVTDSNGIATVVLTNKNAGGATGARIGAGYSAPGNSNDMFRITLQ